jgi:hypothetical protein
VVVALDDQAIRRLEREVVPVRSKHGLDDRRVRTAWRPAAAPNAQLVGDPGGLGALLELADVLLPAPPLHRDHCDEAAAGNEADEEEPPLEFRHVAGRIGRVAERTLARE